jgi:hypothetical protein
MFIMSLEDVVFDSASGMGNAWVRNHDYIQDIQQLSA